MKKTRLLTTTVGGFLFAASIPSHAALITDWDFIFQSGFSAFSPRAPDQASPPSAINDGVVGSALNVGFGGLPAILSWGIDDGSPASSFGVTPTVSSPPSLTTNGAFVNGPAYSYTRSATSGMQISAATSASTILLTPAAPAPGAAIGPIPIVLNFLFAQGDSNDLLVLQDPGELTFSFSRDDYEYTALLGLSGLNQLGADTCRDVLIRGECLGLEIEDGQTGTISTTFEISGRSIEPPAAVPAPAVLPLLSLGLAGLVISRRRKA